MDLEDLFPTDQIAMLLPKEVVTRMASSGCVHAFDTYHIFFTRFKASAFIISQKYPFLKALRAKNVPVV